MKIIDFLYLFVNTLLTFLCKFSEFP